MTMDDEGFRRLGYSYWLTVFWVKEAEAVKRWLVVWRSWVNVVEGLCLTVKGQQRVGVG